MANPTTELISALREAAGRLSNGAVYAWGNHGACNCGQLVQVIGGLSREEILSYTKTGVGEWTELAEDYCGITDAPVSMLVGKLQQIGLTPSDIHHLEYLNDRFVLNHLPGGFRWLQRNNREDVILYFETFASILEEEFLLRVQLRELLNECYEEKMEY
ncbi:MAG: hypothetical protein ACK50E_05505 [Bacteroidota bacterium]|jgi:hypothetical protein